MDGDDIAIHLLIAALAGRFLGQGVAFAPHLWRAGRAGRFLATIRFAFSAALAVLVVAETFEGFPSLRPWQDWAIGLATCAVWLSIGIASWRGTRNRLRSGPAAARMPRS